MNNEEQVAILELKVKELENKNSDLIVKNNRFRQYLDRYRVAYYSFTQMCVYESQKDAHVTHSQRQALAEVRNQILHELGIELSNMASKQQSTEAEDTEYDPIPF